MEGLQIEIEDNITYNIQKSSYGRSLAGIKAKLTLYYVCGKSVEIMEYKV